MRTIALLPVALAIAACALVRPSAPSFDLPADNAPLATSPDDLALINRLTWGANTAAAQAFAQQGRAKFLEQQLTPAKDGGLPRSIESQIAALSTKHEGVQEIAAKLNEQRDAI